MDSSLISRLARLGLLGLAFAAPLAAQAVDDARRVLPQPVPLGEPQPLGAPQAEATLEIYFVGDLIGAPQFEPLPDLLGGADDPMLAEERLAWLEGMEARRQRADTSLVALEEVITAYIEPSWKEVGGDLRAVGYDSLVLLGTPPQHAWLTRFLETQRAATGFVHIEVQVYTVDHDALDSLGIDGTRKLLTDEAAVESLRRGIEQLGFEAFVSTPVVTYPRQDAMVSVLNSMSYISGWELVIVEPGAQTVADPMVETVQEGVVIELRAVPLAPGYWSVDSSVVLSNLKRPIATEQVALGDGSGFAEVGLPVVVKVGLSSRIAVQAGGGAALLAYDQLDGRDVVVLLQVQEWVPEEEEELER